MAAKLPKYSDIVVIGAGPSGSAMASWLADHGVHAIVLEKAVFPRFSIGESLLPEALNCLDELGLLDVVESGDYQYKNGATFVTNDSRYDVDFGNSFSEGIKYAYQVPRADFDARLINRCEEKGAEVFYQANIVKIVAVFDGYRLTIDYRGEEFEMLAGFLVDASGYGRVLARLFNLDKPSLMAEKKVLFCHVESSLEHHEFDRNKILIAQTQAEIPIWYWLIPFTGNVCSAGVVMDSNIQNGSLDDEAAFQSAVSNQRMMSDLVEGKPLLRNVGCLSGYSCSISRLYGDRYVILGNAGEFIDPIFSSGVTIALKSSLLAAPLVLETIKHRTEPDWHNRFQVPLMEGVDTFKQYVMAWYAGILPKVFYSDVKDEDIQKMISGILAGYVWDRNNPFTRMTVAKLESLLAWV